MVCVVGVALLAGAVDSMVMKEEPVVTTMADNVPVCVKSASRSFNKQREANQTQEFYVNTYKIVGNTILIKVDTVLLSGRVIENFGRIQCRLKGNMLYIKWI
jgi:hypothetical protein